MAGCFVFKLLLVVHVILTLSLIITWLSQKDLTLLSSFKAGLHTFVVNFLGCGVPRIVSTRIKFTRHRKVWSHPGEI